MDREGNPISDSCLDWAIILNLGVLGVISPSPSDQPGPLPSNKTLGAGWASPHLCLTVWVGEPGNQVCLVRLQTWFCCLASPGSSSAVPPGDIQLLPNNSQQAPLSYATLFQDKPILTLGKCSSSRCAALSRAEVSRGASGPCRCWASPRNSLQQPSHWSDGGG